MFRVAEQILKQQQVRIPGDVAAGGTIIGTLFGYLPDIAALLGIVWISLQMYWAIKDRKNKHDNSA